ncbi:hypothetical protein ACH6EH_06575 [Paenibacillus sp. JSM ZJ436]|uniref:hypothetical protein n=1 Tax=Paenibacillus sp. JSM ZJ436 TaxID=3376190 RepID=UPI0037A467FD
MISRLFKNDLRNEKNDILSSEFINHKDRHSRGSQDELNAKDIKSSASYANVIDYGADRTGNTNSAQAFLLAFQSDSDSVYIPKGQYLLLSNISVPSNKSLVFDKNATIKIGEGIKLRIDSSWNANHDDFIFDLSLGGILEGDMIHDEIFPEWFGAKGDAVTDDSDAFNYAMKVCNKKRILRLSPKNYKIRRTIDNNARGVKGTARYYDSQNGGSRIIFDPIDKTTDLLPCLRIAAAAYSSEFRDFTIQSTTQYTSKNLSSWVNKSLFEQDKYEMFAVGCAAIEVLGVSTPTFTNIRTSNIKVGLLMNSNNGHITSHECNWSGLIGVYCRRNSGDYFFQGGSVSGAFCGVMLGIILEAGHYGGMDVTMLRVHMGFSPFGFYQVKDADNYDELAEVLGLSASLMTTRFERTGEAVIKLLPKSKSEGIKISGFGLTWSPLDHPSDGSDAWICAMPNDIISRDEKQKFAVYFGTLGNRVDVFDNDFGGIFKSNAPGAVGSAYIHTLSGDGTLKGLDIPNIVVRRKLPSVSLSLSSLHSLDQNMRLKCFNSLASGNLMKNPEVKESWAIVGSTSSTLDVISNTDIDEIPISELRKYLGDSLKIVKFTPDGINSQMIALNALLSTLDLDEDRNICYEFFIYSPKSTIGCRIACSNNKFLYDSSRPVSVNEWTKISGRGEKSSDIRRLEIYSLSPTSPTYIAGVMVNYDEPSPYSPHNHPYTTQAIESLDGIILSSPNKNRYKITIDDQGAINTVKITQ